MKTICLVMMSYCYVIYSLSHPNEFAGLSYAPEITDFMNEIAVKLPDKWQDVGRGLGIQEFELKQIQEWLAAVY